MRHLFLQVYLVNQDTDLDEGAYSFIRKRTTIDKDERLLGTVYQITTVQRTTDGEPIEQKRYVSQCPCGWLLDALQKSNTSLSFFPE